MINIIVSVDVNFAIGCGSSLAVNNRVDMKRFKELTMGDTVVMGRKTLSTLPGSHGLKGRKNIVITHDINSLPPDCIGATSIENALELSSEDDTSWIIGGESIYEAALPYSDSIYLTLNHIKVADATAFFPDIRRDNKWKITYKSNTFTTEDGIDFEYLVLKKM